MSDQVAPRLTNEVQRALNIVTQDYHYESTTEEIKKIQQTVLRRQLRCALKADVRKAITIHTREADEDILTILTEELPVDQKVSAVLVLEVERAR